MTEPHREPATAAPVPGLWTHLQRGLALAMLATLILAFAELVLALCAPPSPSVGTAIVLFGLCLLIIGAFSVPFGLFVGVASYTVMRGWWLYQERRRNRESPVPSGGGNEANARSSRPAEEHPPRHRRSPLGLLRIATGLLALLGALTGHVINATTYVRLYPELHRLLAVAAYFGVLSGLFLLSLGGAPLQARLRGRWRRIAIVVLSPCLAVGGIFVTDAVLRHSHEVKAVAFERTTALAAGLHVIAAMADRDRDGYSELFGGGDCNEHNPFINPAARDYPDNGIDEDCDGADLTSEQIAQAWKVLAPEQGGLPAATNTSDSAPRWNVLLISVDALRWDRVHGARARDLPLPNLQAARARGVQFTRAYAASAWTVSSIYSLFASRLPSQVLWAQIGVSEDERIVINPPLPKGFFGFLAQKKRSPAPLYDPTATLPDHLRATGYLTATFPSYLFFLKNVGLTRGFELNDSAPYHAVRTTGANGDAAVEERLRGFFQRVKAREFQSRPFFAWVHLLETHDPYVGASNLPAAVRYELALQSADARIGRMLGALGNAGLQENTLVVLTGDHGEELGDHGGDFHGATLYEEAVRVPWIFLVPGGAPRRIDTPVSHVDLAPTLLELAGAARPAGLVGRSLAPWLRGAPGEPPARPILAETYRFDAEKRMLIEGHHKLIHDRRRDTRELYDLSTDPLEHRNAIDDDRPRADAMYGRLRRYLEVLELSVPRRAAAEGPWVPGALAPAGPLGRRPGLGGSGAAAPNVQTGAAEHAPADGRAAPSPPTP